ncbi:MAG: DUF167 domain-containing protein [bacterium]
MDSGSEKNNPVNKDPENKNPAQAAPYRFEGGALILRLYIQPGAARTGWGGRHGGSDLKLRVAAPPVEGKANQACLRFLAKAAGVPKGAVTLLRGERSRSKVFRIAPLDEKRFQALKAQWNVS